MGGKIRHRFCPVCGHSLRRQMIKSSEPEQLVCSHCRFIYYLDPKVAVGTIGALDGKVVLLRRGIEPAYGLWVFPGGYVNQGETLVEAGIREAKEEVGLDVRVEKLLNVYSYSGQPVILVTYAVSIVGGELAPCDEAIDVGTFAREEIPWEALAFPSTRDALMDYAERYLED